MPRRRSGYSVDASAAMVAHGLRLSAIRSNEDNDWPVHFHSLMLTFHDLRGIPLR